MKTIALFPLVALLVLVLNSCCACSSCGGKNRWAVVPCEKETVETEVTEYIEEEVYVDYGGKGGKGGTTIVRTPVVRTVLQDVECSTCGSWYCPGEGCCGTISTRVLKRATAQGASGEPHIGQIATMKVLAE
ncbi:MAG: hypothetical protein HKN82_13205 [Akkermansiaceae bacterium]|nr:hypothetical protein [Akkermansiaceae bacterium]NNM30084.1 hypothetical protein [Akkermansiaceae bacterium]